MIPVHPLSNYSKRLAGADDGLSLSGNSVVLPFNADSALHCTVVPPLLCSAAIWSDSQVDWVDVSNITFSKSINAIEMSVPLAQIGLVAGANVRLCAGFVFKRISTIYKLPAKDNSNEGYPIVHYYSYLAFPILNGVATGVAANVNKQPVESITNGVWSSVRRRIFYI
jgi:hypothetical protein